MGELLFDWIPDYGLPADRLVRTKPSGAASQTAQPAAFSTAPGHLPVAASPKSWSSAVGLEETRATACACLRRELSGEPDAGNLHVRFDEGRMSHARVAHPPTLPVLFGANRAATVSTYVVR